MNVINVTHNGSEKKNLSRHEIIKWINDITNTDNKKIENLSNGISYCKCMDLLFPDQLILRKVKMNAKLERECLHNMKILQTYFTKFKVSKVIPIDKIIKARFQDNIEFVQWFKKFFDANRGDKVLSLSKPQVPKAVVRPPKVKKFDTQIGMSPSSITFTTNRSTVDIISESNLNIPIIESILVDKPNEEIDLPAQVTHTNPPTALLIDISNDFEKKTLIKKISEELLQIPSNSLSEFQKRKQAEKERDFYFNKLRKIESFVELFEDKLLSDHFKEALSRIDIILQEKYNL